MTCVFIDKDPDLDGFRGLHVARVHLFLSFRFQGITYSCALVQWFSTYGDSPCEDTGLWRVMPDRAHLIGVAGSQFLPRTFSFSNSLNAFRLFYVNKYADHHAHEIAF
ncbi:hypothetical protein L208DRAFT_1429282 [Tricholoma matsutake]|nr:hypothetical protein L208DRAFT_1429282 [Tricholoma matsutake 945]